MLDWKNISLKAMSLVLVESPTKAKTLKSFLGQSYEVLATLGHVRDLPADSFGIDVKNDFAPEYVIPPKAKKTIEGLKKLIKKTEKVILASVDYGEPVLIQFPDGSIHQLEVGSFIDQILEKKIDYSLFRVPAFDFKTQKISFKPLKGVSRHPIKDNLLEIVLDYGRKLKITPSHSIFTKNQNKTIKLLLGKDLMVDDKILVPLKLPAGNSNTRRIDILKKLYENKEFRNHLFINSPTVSRYRKEKVLSPKIGDTPQFQSRLFLPIRLKIILKKTRRALGLSQKSLAQKMGCSQTTICDWESRKNHPTVSLGRKYLKILGVNFKKAKEQGMKIIPSSLEVAIKNALENQWKDSRKSLTRSWQPLSWFSWSEIENNFRNDRKLKISRHNHSHLMPRFIPVDKDLMLFLGFFIAEGSYLTRGRYVRFSFGKKFFGGEEKNIEKIKRISRKLFNLSPSDFEDKTTNSVVLSSSLVTFLLKDVLGIKGRSETKRIPEIVFSSAPTLQFAFLEGLFLGDGSLGRGNIVFNTVSLILAQGIRLLLLQNGVFTSHGLAISKKPNRLPLHQVIISGKRKLLETKKIWRNHYKSEKMVQYLKKNKRLKKNWSLVSEPEGDLGLLKISAIREIKPTKRFVYDFSVEGENFICGDGGVCAHNTDEDREGESISWHLIQALGLNERKTKNAKRKAYERIAFHEITESAIKQALENPRDIDMNLVSAQQARRILDRIVGYKLSPFLWKKVAQGLSAGRVQSAAVRLIVEREREIQNFKPEEYWQIETLLSKIQISKSKVQTKSQIQSPKTETEFKALLVKKDGKAIPKLGIKTKDEADEIVKDLKGAEYRVASIEQKEIKKNPLPPFTTSTLQQEAWQRFRFPAKFTMGLAQQLYEKGLATYHRTDSLNLSEESLAAAKEYLLKNFGKDYWPGFSRKYKTKSKSAQEAHEAIRPTNPFRDPAVALAKEGLTETALKLYGLIWQRFLASQMAEAIFDSTKVELKAKKYIFEAKGQTLKFDGFLKIYPLSFEESKLPPLAKDESLELNKLLPSQHFTQSPPRYSEASLVKALEKWGVGRPSTYAPILETIQARGYVQKDEKKFFLPTEIGLLVNDLLVTHFPEVVDVNFTAKMEVQLDQISEGKKTWLPVVRDFWTPFSQNLKTKEKEVSKKEVLAKLSQETVNEPCPECAAPLVVKFSRFGKFYACSRFPDCKYKKNSHRSLKILCPKCREGEIVERMTRKRKRFYGCSGWPRCDFALWDKPTGQTCPQCQSLMVKKWGREKCSHKDCSTVKK